MKWILVGAAVFVLGTLLTIWLAHDVNSTAAAVGVVGTGVTGSLLVTRGVHD